MKHKTSFKLISVLALLVLALSFQFFISKSNYNYAYAQIGEEVSITNGSFNSNPNSYYLDSNPNGWTLIDSSLSTTSGVINTNSEKFSTYTNTYNLSTNPETYYKDSSDTKILMINAKSSVSTTSSFNQGYKSSNLTLFPYSYYHFSVLVKTEIGAIASIYLKSENEENSLSFEKIVSTKWSEYHFYIETGSNNETVHFELYLGTESVKSPNAVFFDNVTGYKLSKTSFDSEKSSNEKSKILTIEKNYITSVTNSNFENGIEGWTSLSAFPAGTIHKVINTNDPQIMTSEGFEYLGGDNVEGNRALWLASKTAKERGFGFSSTEIELPAYSIYKVNVNAKVGNNTTARIVVVEGDKVENFYSKEGFYNANSAELTISSNNDSSTVLNGYKTYSFYIYGHTLFDSSFHIELWLGTETEGVSGSVLFDNITIESLTYAEFKNASDSSETKKLELKTTTESTTIKNGVFNLAEPNNSYPVIPQNWTSEIENKTNNIAGIVNTNESMYNKYKENYGNISNPGNPQGFSSDLAKESNNILMLWNKNSSYQSFTTESVNVTSKTTSSESFYDFSFDFKTIANIDTINFNLQIFDQNSVKVFESENISSSVWQKFKISIRVGESTSALTFKFSLGTQANKTQGYLFIDNVDLNSNSSLTLEQFTELANNNGRFNKILDLTNAYMNIRLLPNSYGIYENIAFDGKLEQGFQPDNSDPISETGIVDGTNNIFEINNAPENFNVIKNLMFIQNHTSSTYSLTSTFKNSLEADKIYKLSVYLRTKLQTPENDYKKDYGASFELVGLEGKLENIKTNNEWKQYTIYVNTTTATEVNLKFALTTQNETAGLLFIDNFNISEITSDEYASIVNSQEENKTDNVLIIGSTDIKSEENPQEPSDENDFNWLIVPALITSLALIIAVVGFSLRHVKFKKWQKKKITEYDRNRTLYQDVVRRQAQEKRDEILKDYNIQLKQLEQEILAIEEENKARLEKQRKEKGKKIDKQVEKEFKAYATKHTNLTNKKDKLLEKIKEANSTDFLLNLQRKLRSENAKKIALEESQIKQEKIEDDSLAQASNNSNEDTKQD